MGFILAIVIVVLPYALLAIPGIPPWLGRLLGACILVFGGTLLFFLAGLVPELGLSSVGPKLRRPEYDAIRPTMEKRLRFIFIGFGLLICFFVTFPVANDLIRMCAGQKPMRITETVHSTSTLFGAWFLVQFVDFPSGAGSDTLLYSVTPLRANTGYQFLILRRSHLILDFRRIP